MAWSDTDPDTFSGRTNVSSLPTVASNPGGIVEAEAVGMGEGNIGLQAVDMGLEATTTFWQKRAILVEGDMVPV